MIIDDERALAGSIARMLGGSFGVEIEVDSKTALDRLLADPASVDLILCDYSMPELGGKELFEALRAKQPNLASRFAFMTGGATDEEAMLFLRGQLQPVIEKPFQKASIVAMLSDLHAATTKDSAR
jgi:CheY-like chemotaxis protein